MIQYFEKITLNTSVSNSATTLNTNLTNTYLTDFELDKLFLVQDIEFIINTLLNKAFAHCLIAKDDTIEIIIKLISYSYITSNESRYDDWEFKNLLID